ncbi:MAG: hypothetical protein HXY18_15890 [Bryobacteraceae bacterium]|nr:hypothetical protein [Bryobacteraceae bacterium]
MIRLLTLTLVGSALAVAAGRCTVAAAPQPIAAEGAAELVSAVAIECSGLAAGQVVEGSVGVSFSRRVSNRRSGEVLEGPVFELEAAPGVWTAFPAAAVLADQATVRFDNLRWTAGSNGAFNLRVRGVRVDAAAERVEASVRLFLSERLDLPVQRVAVGEGQNSLAAALMNTLATRGPAPGADADFRAMMRLQPPVAAVRVTEGYPSAFAAGTRFLIRFAGVPEGVRMLLPDVVAGSSGMFPTRSGVFGRAADAGGQTIDGSPQLLLVRVMGAQINGEGGLAAASGFGALRAAETGRGTPYGVYEVVSADAARMESAEIPAWVAVPPGFDTPFGESIVRPTVLLAPVSESEGAHPTAPVPRYKPVSPAADCEIVGDCTALWFPRMRIVEPSPLNFTAVAGGGLQIGRAGVNNDGGGLLEWRVGVRAPAGFTWLSNSDGTGVQNGGIQYDVNPAGLSPGDYEAQLVFEQIAPPTGRRDERAYTVRLKVTPAPVTPPPVTPPVKPPPTAPAPQIESVTIGPARLGPPFAAGSLIQVTGTFFGERPEANVAGVAAQVVTAAGGVIGVILPETLPAGRHPLVVRSGEVSSAAWMIEVVPSAPVLLFALNEDGAPNSADAPAARGGLIHLYATGLPVGATAGAMIHDRGVDTTVEEGGKPGVRLILIQVPSDLPAMKTTAAVTIGGVVSHPLDIWIR